MGGGVVVVIRGFRRGRGRRDFDANMDVFGAG